MYRETVPAKLKKARLNTGFTQKEVGKEVGISQSQMTKYETGRLEPGIEDLAKLIDFYGVSADWILGTKGANKQ